jgi:hypothetical protein
MKMLSYMALIGVLSISDVDATQKLSCVMQVQNCRRSMGKLTNYSDALKDSTIASKFAKY